MKGQIKKCEWEGKKKEKKKRKAMTTPGAIMEEGKQKLVKEMRVGGIKEGR